ncbi:MAG: alpha/beta hydrolase [Candidatus Eremiobacteraeota bacterium]|nr:alpha/beta hydrolase [Candidatus Eremiobacteraeota bacterium]
MRPPSKLLWLAEYRSLWEIGFALSASGLLLTAPRGDGHPVLVLPGFLVSDISTTMLRNYLKLLGYETHGWELGRNLGGIARMRSKLRERLQLIHDKNGKKVSIVGWSLGGVYARDLAIQMPDVVRSVITLGSPFSRSPNASNISDLYEVVSGEGPWDDGTPMVHEFDAIADDLTMPSTSIWSKVDGIVNWESSVLNANARTENIEVIGASHVGLGGNAAVLWAVADRLAQPEGAFAPFARTGPFAIAYGAGAAR